MPRNSTPPGYLDRYDRETKDWKKVLFRPGKVVQSSELNEIQSILTSEQQEIGNTLYGDGTIIEGCSIIINNTRTSISTTKGKFYSLGYVHEVPELTIPITGVGIEKLGLSLSPIAITESVDPSLLNNATDTDAYGKPGAHRLKYTYSLSINNPTATTIAILTNGLLSTVYNRTLPLLDPFMKILAQRTYEESGNYTVDKYNVKIEDITEDVNLVNTHLRVVIKNGISYVSGYRSQNYGSSYNIARPLLTANRVDEPETFVSNKFKYDMDEYPVRTVDNVTAIVRSPKFTRIRGPVAGGLDEIPEEYQPIARIHSVTDNTPKTYIEGTDYVQNGDNIDWSPGGDAPSSGSTYYVEIDYVRQMVKGIRTLTSVNGETVVRGGGDTDALAHNNLQVISSIVKGATTYTLAHYSYDKKTGVITWLGATRPTGSYQVTYDYWVHTIEGDYLGRDSFIKDSVIQYDNTPDYLFNSVDTIDYKSYISFDTDSTDVKYTTAPIKPVPGQLVYYDYKYSLARHDILVTDKSGILTIIEGQSSEAPKGPKPLPGQMRICTFRLPAEARASDVIIEMAENQRLTMEELRIMLEEINKIQYNQAVFQLAQDTAALTTPTDKLGVLADNFVTHELMDLGNMDFSCTLDPIFRSVSLPQDGQMVMLTKTGLNWMEDGSLLFKPFTESVAAVQPYATNYIQVNPYGFANVKKRFTVTPRFDRFEISNVVYTTQLQYHNEAHAFFMKHREWLDYLKNVSKPRPPVPSSLMTPEIIEDLKKVYGSNANIAGIMNAYNKNAWSDVIYDNIKVTPSQYARVIDVTLDGLDYTPLDELTVSFDGKFLPLTALTDTLQLTDGKIQVKADGSWKAKFTVPENTLAGSHTISVSSSITTAPVVVQRSWVSEGVVKSGSAITKFSLYDPIAQTFTIDEDFFLSSIVVYFGSKVNGDIVQLHIVEVENGIPTTNCLATAEVQSNTIVVGTLNAPGAGTKFVFSQPARIVKGKDYAFIVKVDDPSFTIMHSTLGFTDPINGTVAKQPFSGVMMSSANMQSWSAHQTSDVKFIINKSDFNTSDYEVEFDPVIFSSDVSRFETNVKHEDTGPDSLVIWKYSIGNSGSWKDFDPGLEVNVGRRFTELRIKAIMKGTESMSPILYAGMYVIGYLYKDSGSYIARRYELPEPDARYVDVYVDVYTPQSTVVTPVVQIDESGTWVEMDHLPLDDRQLDQKYWEKHYRFDCRESDPGADLFSKIHCRVNLLTSDRTKSPEIKRFRSLTRGLV